ncbi:MAG: lipid-A-disaccharide synthase [Cyanobacteria bacterium J06638_20]
MARIFISTGEVSGDLQGALLVKALRRQAAERGIDLEILALGGDRMAAAGATLLENTTAVGSIGIFESLPYVLPTLSIQRRAKAYLREHPPDLVVMIDYLTPNLAMGQFARSALPGVPTVYYIAPQEWVWSAGAGNTRRIIQNSDEIFAVFPEEATYYKKWGVHVTYLGHPLVDQVASFPSREAARQALEIPPEQVAIAFIPASRRQEVTYLLPVMAEAAQQIQSALPNAHFWIPVSQAAFRSALEETVQRFELQATLMDQASQTVIAAADLALTKSGTVNLELALMNVPQVVAYRLNPVTAWIARTLLNFSIPYMSPTNLVLMEDIVPEFLQDRATPETLSNEALTLLQNDAARQRMLSGYQRVQQAMGELGVCDRLAVRLFEIMAATSSPAN